MPCYIRPYIMPCRAMSGRALLRCVMHLVMQVVHCSSPLLDGVTLLDTPGVLAGVPVCQCASVPVCKCASVPVCKCASVPVCQCASVTVA